MDTPDAKARTQALACDLLTRSLRIALDHDPRSLTARAAVNVALYAAYAVQAEPGEIREDGGDLLGLAATLREIIITDPANAEAAARRLKFLLREALSASYASRQMNRGASPQASEAE